MHPNDFTAAMMANIRHAELHTEAEQERRARQGQRRGSRVTPVLAATRRRPRVGFGAVAAWVAQSVLPRRERLGAES